jgi:hypothetical protein
MTPYAPGDVVVSGNLRGTVIVVQTAGSELRLRVRWALRGGPIVWLRAAECRRVEMGEEGER